MSTQKKLRPSKYEDEDEVMIISGTPNLNSYLSGEKEKIDKKFEDKINKDLNIITKKLHELKIQPTYISTVHFDEIKDEDLKQKQKRGRNHPQESSRNHPQESSKRFQFV